MLVHLSIRDFALIGALDIELEPGMTVVTGETGAGKSIMLDALGLALGDRADAGVVRHGCDRAEVVAQFDISGLAEARVWLEARELDADDECILRRVINAGGRSRAFINGAPVTLADLRSLGELLIEIHGQHEHQRLLARENHLPLLDRYAGLEAQAGEVARLWRGWQAAREALDQARRSADDTDARLQLLEYQVGELDKLAPRPGEYEALEQEQSELANAGALLQSGDLVRQLLAEGDGGSCSELLNQALAQLDNLKVESPALAEVRAMLDSALIQIEEASSELGRYLDRVELDPARLAEVEERIGQYYQLARKHRVAPEELPTLHQQLAEELGALRRPEDVLAELGAREEAAREAYLAACAPLGEERRRAAAELGERVNEQLARLGMSNASLTVAVTDAEPSPRGCEQVELLVSTNPGQPPRPLAKIASGGELSRISLAIQVVTAERGATPVLAFDEVDVGIGGATAEVVGRLLRTLGERCQVLCVTHQPQVAARGHHHLFVSKSAGEQGVLSCVTRLEGESRVSEIARMLSGVDLTRRSLDHAAEMLAG